jgi:hypothetical protein
MRQQLFHRFAITNDASIDIEANIGYAGSIAKSGELSTEADAVVIACDAG